MEDMVLVDFGKESEFIENARFLGLETLYLVYKGKNKSKLTIDVKKELKKSSKVKLKFLLLLEDEKNLKKGVFDGIVELGTSKTVLSRGINYVYGNEYADEKDAIHQRRSGLNHVILKEMIKKGVTVIFDYGSLRSLSTDKQAKILGRMSQNLILCKKLNVNYMFASMAKTPLEMRHPKDVQGLIRSLS